MARTVRNPMETRTPVRTISSVMRNAPRQEFTPQRIDRGFTRKTPISDAVSSTFAPERGTSPRVATSRPAAPVTSTIKAPITSVTKTPASSVTSSGSKPAVVTKPTVVAKPSAGKAPAATKTATSIRPASPAVKSTGSTKATTPATKPITSTTKTPAKAVTTPTTKTPAKSVTSTTTKPAVAPITSKTNAPTTPKKTSTSSTNPITSILNNPIGKTLIGAGTGALVGKLLGGNKTTTGGTGVRPSSGTNLPSMGGGQGLKPPVSGGGTGLKLPGGTTKVTPKSPTAGGTAGAAKTAEEIKAENPELTDEQVQAELDRVKAEEGSYGVPEDATLNEDGTYTVTDADGNISTYSADGQLIGYEGPGTTEGDGTTRSLAGDTTGDTTDAASADNYYQDDNGNIYDGNGNLLYSLGEDGSYYDANGDLYSDQSTSDTLAQDNTWTDPDTGEVWNLAEDGSWSLEGDTTNYDDYTVADNTDNTDNTDYTSYDDGEPVVKKGGSIHQKTKSGLPRFAEGDAVYSDTTEEVQPWQNVDYNYGESDSPTMTGDNSLYASSGPYSATYDSRTLTDSPVGSDFTPVPGRQYFDDGSYIDTFDDGSTMTYDSDGNLVDTTEASTTTYDDAGNAIVTDGYGNVTVYDPNGNRIPVGGGKVTSAGSGNKQSFASQLYNSTVGQKGQDESGILDALKGYVTQNPGLAGGAIGALLASLMNDSGGGGGSNQAPVDISQLAAFAPRTTDFGPGMAGGRTGTGSPIVSYADYAEGYGDETPDERLYSDLGISGWLNEPEMTDYTDENGAPVDQYGNYLDDAETPAEDSTEVAEEPTMAAGGPTTHYTFGRVIDPAESLGVAQGMKKGGLSQAHTVHSHHTNPVIDDRVDFRRGSAVNGAGDGQSDDIPAWLADGEYVIDAELVSMLGNGSNKAGAKVLDKFREEVRNHKRSAPLNKIPPKAKSPLNYLKEAMNG